MSKLQTVYFKNKPRIKGYYSIVGPKEGQSNFADYFDYVLKNDCFGEKSFEKTERKLLEQAIFGAVDKSKLGINDISMMISGDLLNQIISSSYSARELDMVYLGVFGACSTMAESLALGAMFVNGGHFDNVVCATSSHFSSAERQFRYPLELGNQRPPTSQWTVTGAGATVLCRGSIGPFISSATFGKVVDYGINDVNNMGGAMMPAAASTLKAHFLATKTSPKDYDLIVTGDLGKHGSDALIDFLEMDGINLRENYGDCGQMYFTKDQKTFMGGSGPACSATILNSYILKQMFDKKLNKVLFVATGALLSTTSVQQGNTIPCIAHAVVIENEKGESK